MRKLLKLLGLLAFAGILFIVAAILAFYHLVQVGEFRRFLVEQIERGTDLKVELGEAKLEVGRVLGVSFRDFSLSEPGAARPAISSDRITARVAFLPLVRRKLTFYEIRLSRPSVQLVRERDGSTPLLDRLSSLPFLKEREAKFSLDLRVIRLEQGEVIFADHKNDGDPTVTRFRQIELNLKRLRGTELSDFISNELLKRVDVKDHGPALDFDVTTTIEQYDKKTALRSRGRVVFPIGSMEIRRAWWKADVQLTGLPGKTARDLLGPWFETRSITGVFSARFRLEGDLERQLRLTADIEYQRLALDAPDVFAAPLNAGDGRAEIEVVRTPQNLGFPRVDLRFQDIELSLKGAVHSVADGDPSIEATLTTPFIPLNAARNFLPVKFLQSPRVDRWLATIREGQFKVTRAGIAGKLSELRRIGAAGSEARVSFDVEVKDAGFNLPDNRYFPVRGVSGRWMLEKETLSFTDVKGRYGESRVTEADGRYSDVFSGSGSMDLRARGELELAELKEQLKLDLFPGQAAKLAANIQELDGKGKFGLVVRQRADAPLHFEGKVALEHARLRLDDLSLTELKGELVLSPKEIRAEKASALLFGSPLNLRLAVKDYLSDKGSFDLAIDSSGVKAGVVARLLLATGTAQDPGTVRGAVRYNGSLAGKGERKFTGTLNLAGVQLKPQPLKQPLRELTGRVRIDEAGIEFQNLKGLIVGSAFEFEGRWRYTQEPELLFSFGAPSLDIGYLMSQIDEESGDWYDHLQARGKVKIGSGKYEGFEFTDLTSDVQLDRRVWKLGQFSARSAGGTVLGVGTITDKPDLLGFVVEPRVQGIPVKGFFSWFDMGTTEITGRINLDGRLESVGKSGAERKKNLNGAFALKIEDGVVRRLRVLVQILNLLDLSRWFTLQMPDINKEGIRFRSITGDFKVAKGVYSTQNLLVDSDDLRMTGAGTIDVPNDNINFVVAVRPFPGIDSAINIIPLIGRGIAAIKNSLLVASFNIKGPIDDPTITPAPLSTLSEVFFGVLGIPKKIIGVSGDDKKDAPKPPVSAPAQETPP